MIDVKSFRDVIKRRIKISKETQDEWDFGIEQCWKEMLKIFCKNIDDTIDFLNTECTSEEYYWISEIFDDITRETQSKKFIDCIEKLQEKFPNACEQCNIAGSIAFAKEELLE